MYATRCKFYRDFVVPCRYTNTTLHLSPSASIIIQKATIKNLPLRFCEKEKGRKREEESKRHRDDEVEPE